MCNYFCAEGMCMRKNVVWIPIEVMDIVYVVLIDELLAMLW